MATHGQWRLNARVGVSKSVTSVNLYDFDHTIYDGDATLDFYVFCLKRNPLLLRFLPGQVWHTAMFALRLESRTAYKGHFFAFLRGLANPNQTVGLFWDRHYYKIQSWYLKTDRSRDVIVSSSPEFLLSEASRRLGALALIATQMDAHTGLITGQNCRGAAKVERFREQFADAQVENAYSDHMSDLPLLKLAKNPYLVKGNVITPLPS